MYKPMITSLLKNLFLSSKNYKYAKYIYSSNLTRYRLMEFGCVHPNGARVSDIQNDIEWYFKNKPKDYTQLYEIIIPKYIDELSFLRGVGYVFITDDDAQLWGLTEIGREAFRNGCFRNEYITAFYSMMSINQTALNGLISFIALTVAIIALL